MINLKDGILKVIMNLLKIDLVFFMGLVVLVSCKGKHEEVQQTVKTVKTFDFINDKININDINQKVGEPDSFSSDGTTMEYKIENTKNLFIKLSYEKKILFVGMEEKGSLIKYIYSSNNSQEPKVKYSIYKLKKLRKNMQYMDIFKELSFSHGFTKGWNPKILYYLSDGTIAAMEYDKGLQSVEILDKDYKFIRNYDLK